jgi:hypothetical protein
VAALVTRQAACPTEGISCRETIEELTRATTCYDNGVRSDIDGDSNATTAERVTVFQPDGRECYHTEVVDQIQGKIFTVKDPAGAVIIIEYYRDGLESMYACPDGHTLEDNPDRPCGIINTIPNDVLCPGGLCLRP